jgi:hypothetical protein
MSNLMHDWRRQYRITAPTIQERSGAALSATNHTNLVMKFTIPKLLPATQTIPFYNDVNLQGIVRVDMFQ